MLRGPAHTLPPAQSATTRASALHPRSDATDILKRFGAIFQIDAVVIKVEIKRLTCGGILVVFRRACRIVREVSKP